MAVVHFKETTVRSGSEDFETRREYTRTFQALTSGPLDGADVVRADPRVPNRGDAFTYTDNLGTVRTDASSRCVSVRVTQDDPDCYENWTVTAEYRGINDPVFEAPDVKWATTPYQAAKLKDTLGTVYKNSAGDPFEGGRLVDADRFALTITRNVIAAGWDPIQGELFNNSLNSQAFLAVRHPPGLAPGTCKLKMTADLVWYPGSKTAYYWRRTATIEYRREGWAGKVRDAGYRAIIAGKFGGEPVPIIGKNGTRPTHPVLLDGFGAELPVGGTPKEITYADYHTRDWGPLDLEY